MQTDVRVERIKNCMCLSKSLDSVVPNKILFFQDQVRSQDTVFVIAGICGR